MGYVYPDLVLIHSDSENKLSAVFLVVEIKALPNVDWNTTAGKDRASALLTKATKQAQTQAKLAFLQHKDQSSIQAFLACGVWWLTIRYSRSEILNAPAEPQRTSRRGGPSRDQGTKRSRRSRKKHKSNKKTKGMDFPWRVCTFVFTTVSQIHTAQMRVAPTAPLGGCARESQIHKARLPLTKKTMMTIIRWPETIFRTGR